MSEYDLIVIGSGPGGYVAAIKAAQLGLKCACIEGRETLGGTCLNIGCIPSKALLHATHSLHEATHNFSEMGLTGVKPKVDWDQMQAYKEKVIGQNTKGIEFLFKKNKIDWIKGWAEFVTPNEVRVKDKTYRAKSILIATGSTAAQLPGVEVDETHIVTSTGALSLAKPPKKMVIIGAGVIGLEIGSVYARLGSEITVLEYMDSIVPGLDGELGVQFQRLLKKQGFNFVLGASVKKAQVKNGKAVVQYDIAGGKEEKLESDVVLLATGRRAFTDGLGLEKVGVSFDERGVILTDENWQTNISGIYAIGDATRGPMLAHKASEEGSALACKLAGRAGHVNYNVIPSVIYTHPEIASVGLSEEALKAEGRAYRVGKFPLMGNARAKAVFASEGFVKILADQTTDRILGAHIIAPNAGELIHEICVAMEFGASAEDIALTCHAHPTVSESIHEAALACGDGAIHV